MAAAAAVGYATADSVASAYTDAADVAAGADWGWWPRDAAKTNSVCLDYPNELICYCHCC